MENKALHLRGNPGIRPGEGGETRTVEFVISDETRDRHGTVIPINCRGKSKNYKQKQGSSATSMMYMADGENQTQI